MQKKNPPAVGGIAVRGRRWSVRKTGALLVVLICGFSGQLELLVGLVEQIFGFPGVTFHVPFVGFLCRDHALIGLGRQPLG